MKNVLVALALAAVMALSAGCGKQATPEEKVRKTITDSTSYSLTPEDRSRAMKNARAHFEKEWPTKDRDGNMTKERGFVNLVRPSDSNTNGYVSVIGTIPVINGGYKEVKVFCGYLPELDGCSDEDTVQK